MRTPLLALHKALVSELKRLGYASIGEPTAAKPVVLIDQMNLNNSKTIKGVQDYDITFVFDVVTRSASPIQAYGVIEAIRAGLHLQIPDYLIENIDFEECNGLQEIDDAGDIYRQIQRIRIKLT